MRDFDIVGAGLAMLCGIVGMGLIMLLQTTYKEPEEITPCENQVQTTRLTLAQRCAHLYDPGNTDIDSPWKICMGVGPKE